MNNTLPTVQEFFSVKDAEITIIKLGSSMQEHAFIIGKCLFYVKKELGHGEFEKWIDKKMWFTSRTARNFIHFAKECEKKGVLIDKPHYYLESPKSEKFSDLENSPLPEGKFDIIYADPPWRYEHNPSGDENRSIEKNYPTLELGEIKTMQIPSAENSVLFLWTTAPKLKESIEVMDAWGFNYRTCAIWDKKIIGMGYWFRGQHELLLVGVKGEFSPPREKDRPSSVYQEQRSSFHSKKPDYFYEMIEKMYPHGKYLEIFARNKRKNWTSWGNEIDPAKDK